MAPTPNPLLYFASIPKGYPVPGETIKYDASNSIDVEKVDLQGGFLTKTLYLSLDPYLRGKMRDVNIKSFVPPWAIGQILDNTGIAVVIRSETAALKPGDHVMGYLPFEHYTLHKAEETADFRVLKNEEGLSWSLYLGMVGMPGETGYYGLKEYGEAKKGESIYVSTGAGPVGAMVCQLSKSLGLRVLASAGSEEKVAYMRDVLGVDRAFNYKTSSVEEELQKFGGIDIYWDNVGGPTLEAAIANMNVHGRIIICGMASEYNDEEKHAFKNLSRMIYWRLKMVGFVVGDLRPKYVDEFYATVPKMVKDGKLKYTENIVEGLQNAPEAFLALMKGQNTGKVVVKVQDEFSS